MSWRAASFVTYQTNNLGTDASEEAKQAVDDFAAWYDQLPKPPSTSGSPLLK